MKKTTKILALAVVVILILLSIRTCSSKEQKKESVPVITNTNLITNPPISDLEIPYQKFEIDPTQPNVLQSTLGATINIPANAFLDIDGNVIKDKVEISFREFYNPLDFYLAGIPMNYTDEGEEKVFESAGMVEINANSNKKELFVNPDNKIKVELLSFTKSPDFNLYDLDKKTGQWINKGKDIINSTSEVEELNKLPAIPPLPKMASVYSFKIIDDTKLFPEIEDYKNVLFEPIDVSKCEISNAQEMIVKPLKNGIYEITSILKLGSFKKEKKCKCYLAFEVGKDYNDALKLYQKKYSKLINERELIKKPWTEYYKIVDLHRKHAVSKLAIEEKITRTLEINNFGFVNCDYPTSYPSGGTINPNYVDKDGNTLVLKNIVLVEKNTNALFRYPKKIKYNPENDNILWGLTNDNKIAYIKKEDFKLLKSSTLQIQNIPMHIHENEVKTYEEIMGVLFK